MPALPIERVTTALITMLATAVGVPVGDHGTAGIDTSGRYLVVERIEGGSVSGSFGDPHQQVAVVYQVESVGRSRNQAEGLADRVRAAMVDVAPAGGHVHSLAGAGWRGGLRSQLTEGSPTPEGIDEQGTVGVWAQRERFTVEVNPA